LSLAYLGTADQVPAWESLFALFKTKYPNIDLTAQANPANDWAGFFDAISTQIAGGKSPDIVQVATEGQRLFASRGLSSQSTIFSIVTRTNSRTFSPTYIPT